MFGVALGWRTGAAMRFAFVAALGALVRFSSKGWRARWVPRRAIVPLERMIVRFCNLDIFDPDWYSHANPDVAGAGVDPLSHYLSCGWREARAPNPYFDDGHYRAVAGLSRDAPVSALAHFLAVGRHSGLAPVPVADPQALGRAAPELEVARMNGYGGLVSGKIAAPDEGRPELEAVLARLDALEVRELAAKVDVVIPVYGGRAETLNTLWHVLTAPNDLAAEIVVVDDATPDTDLARDLDRLAACGLITLLRNAENIGFPGSINRGQALHPDRDVIWLNADTEVYPGWIDRLHSAAQSRPDVATVTPLTNNGTICSYPYPDRDNFGELEIGWGALDSLAARVNDGITVESPTAVGFATYVRRAALNAIGDLDAQRFGKGYGEENDFSQRAIRAGWCNLLAADVVVRHFGATSFQGKRRDRIDAAMRQMDRLHPRYRKDVARFFADDPLGQARRRLDLARLARGPAGRSILLVTHSRGGGTAQHVQERTARLKDDGWRVFVLSGGLHGSGTARLTRDGAGPLPSFEAMDLSGDELWSILADLKISRAEIHHLIDFPQSAPGLFRRRLRAAGIAYDFVVHDYFAICPRINLIDQRGHYCGEPDLAGCRRCLSRRGSVAGQPDIGLWRARHGALLRGAVEVRVPDDDVAARLQRYFPSLSPTTLAHDDALPLPRPTPGAAPDGTLRVAILGAIGPIKGFDAVLALARHVRTAPTPVEISVIGYTHNDAAARAAGIRVTGPYTNDRIQQLIAQTDPHVIWIPSLWPETYCYTLSSANEVSLRPRERRAVGSTERARAALSARPAGRFGGRCCDPRALRIRARGARLGAGIGELPRIHGARTRDHCFRSVRI